MSEEKMEDYMEDIENSVKNIEKGDIIKGTVISVNNKEAVLDINYSSEGLLTKEELTYDKSQNVDELLSEGDELDVYVDELEDEEGNVILSKLKADKAMGIKDIENAHESGEIIEVNVFKEVNGGVLANYKGVKLFIPASLLSVDYIEDLSEFIGKDLEIKIIELDLDKNRIIGSRKAVESKEREAQKEEVLSTLEKGDIVTGRVTRLAKFGAFVDLGGIDGLIHISEMSWRRIDHPNEVLNEGQEVKVEVLKVDKDEERISLRLEKFEDNPWNDIEDKFDVGQVVKGKVKRIANFGAFVEIDKGIEGLVHISQISDAHVEKVEDELTVGDTINVKILNIDTEEEKVALSMKEAEEQVDYQAEEDEDALTLGDVFEDKFKDIKFD